MSLEDAMDYAVKKMEESKERTKQRRIEEEQNKKIEKAADSGSPSTKQ